MYYAERQELASMLHRFIHHESHYDDMKKGLLLAIVKKFRDHGFKFLEPASQKEFLQLVAEAGG